MTPICKQSRIQINVSSSNLGLRVKKIIHEELNIVHMNNIYKEDYLLLKGKYRIQTDVENSLV